MKLTTAESSGFLLRTMAVTLLAFSGYSATAQDIEKGKEIYYLNGCYTCHGYQGKGTFVLRQNILTPTPPVLVKGKAPFLASEVLFRTYLRMRGEQRHDKPSVEMPHYPATTIDDTGVASLYAFISLFSEDEPDLEDIPAMQWILDWEESR